MLILSQKRNQTVNVYDDNGNLICTVTVTAIDRNRVRVGYKAKPEIHFVREEIDTASDNGGES